ncbi:MAG: hypothetical protein ACYS74_09735, partial [Planctomycetota bacterium]
TQTSSGLTGVIISISAQAPVNHQRRNAEHAVPGRSGPARAGAPSVAEGPPPGTVMRPFTAFPKGRTLSIRSRDSRRAGPTLSSPALMAG